MALLRQTFLPFSDDWDKALAKVNLKKDNGIGKALDEFMKLGGDEPEKRLTLLPKILKLATDFKKSKEVIAAGKDAVGLVDELLALIPKTKKQLEDDKKDFAKHGAHEIDVQFIVMDWNGNNFSSAEGFATFESPGTPKVTKKGSVTGNGFTFSGVKLRPSGSVYLMISRTSGIIEGTTDYEFKPGKDIMKFKAIQHHKTHKTRAKTLDEATQKTGVKGSVGIEFEVIKVGGEVSKESEYKKGYEDEVEWEIETGVPTFVDFKQI
jgi:hypothetical protein